MQESEHSLDIGVIASIINRLAVATKLDQIAVSHFCKVLGQGRLAELRHPGELAYIDFVLRQDLKNFQTLPVRQQ